MRTTVEIDDSQRAELLKLAAQRGEKGFAAIVREALNFFIERHRDKRKVVAQALKLQGTFSDDEADALQASVRQLRERWQ
jgi:Ribbon-helix-helix protein, copG family